MASTSAIDLTSVDDFERCYRAVESRDSRFDGWFITGVLSTGIYCRPSCPTPVRPHRKNVQFFPTSAAAQGAGLRACKRCRPDASPGSPEWDLRADLAGRAMRLIADGLVDRAGVGGLAAHLAVSERTLNRVLQKEVGASPIALARSQRAQASRVLIETTDMKFSDIAFAAGFQSIRQFNDTVREVFALTPSDLRSRRGSIGADHGGGSIGLRLAVRYPFSVEPLVAWIAGHAPDGVVRVADGVIRRTLGLPNGPGLVTLTPAVDHIWAEFSLTAFADLSVAVSRVRRLLDLDADPQSVGECFEGSALHDVFLRDPGLRVPGTVDGFEQAIMTIVGQQVSVAAGRTFGSRLVERFGESVRFSTGGGADDGEEWRVFPTPEALASADLAPTGLTGARQRTISGLAQAVVDGQLDLTPGADRAQTRADLLGLAGIGPWTADIIAMRALGDPDIFPVGDLVLRKAAALCGLTEAGAKDNAAELATVAESWSPWRSYAAHHLWASMYPTPSGATPEVL